MIILKHCSYLSVFGAALLITFGCGESKEKSTDERDVRKAAEDTRVKTPPAAVQTDHHESGAGEHESSAAIPATAADIWRAVEEERKELDAVIAAGKLDQVHSVAFHIRDLLAALPQHSSLSPEATTTLDDGITRVRQLAASLDEAGDAGRATEVAALNQRFNAVIEQVRLLFPAR